jgi:hypothetical protein
MKMSKIKLINKNPINHKNINKEYHKLTNKMK